MAKRKTSTATAKPDCCICLYGSARAAGWIAQHAGGMIGNGELATDGLTGAMWHALESLRTAGCKMAAVHSPCGTRVAFTAPGGLWPYYGDLEWKPAGPAIEISTAELVAATA